MTFHYVLPGSTALGRHAAGRLLGRLQGIDAAVNRVDANYFYLVASRIELSGDDRLRLQALLDEAPAAAPSEAAAVEIHVTARVGTLSPWSTKATDIAHNCAMAHVERI